MTDILLDITAYLLAAVFLVACWLDSAQES